MKKISNKKQKQLDEFQASPILVGEKVSIMPCHVEYYGSDKHSELYDVIKVNNKTIIIKGRNKNIKINKDKILGRWKAWEIGANPFIEKYNSVRPVAFSMDSIIHSLELSEKRRDENYVIGGVKTIEVNWNPFIYDKNGNKVCYQRGFVWNTEQKQLLIESIYKGISCGVILIRKRGWKTLEKMAENGETEIAFSDIVDGKQRLDAVRGFIKGDFPDIHGNYFADLSNKSQHLFGNHQLFQYAEMSENTSDEETLFQFLKMNHEGVPQSKEHLKFVEKLLINMK